jgi:hypothetical protein
VRSLAYTVGLPKRHPLPPKLKKTRKRKKGGERRKGRMSKKLLPQDEP